MGDLWSIILFYQTYAILAVSLYGVWIAINIIGFWKVFDKAGKPGWASIVPIYNYIVLLELVGRPAWWFIFFLIPGVSVVFYIIVFCFDLSKSFGREGGFALGLLFLNPVFMLILAFDESCRYQGPIASRPLYNDNQQYGYQARGYQQAPPPPTPAYPPQTNYPPQPAYAPRRSEPQTALPPARAKKPHVAAWLIDKQGHTIQLFQGETTLGKMSENDIQVQDTTVSRRHAKISERNGHFSIMDLGSTNGTRVNGHLVKTAVSLVPDDEIQLGDNTRFRFKN